MTKLSYNGSVCDICRNRHAGRGPSAAEAAPNQAHETKEAHRIEMKVYVCSICGYVYAEALGIPETGIAPGTRWEDLPDAWVCPLCKAAKRDFLSLIHISYRATHTLNQYIYFIKCKGRRKG